MTAPDFAVDLSRGMEAEDRLQRLLASVAHGTWEAKNPTNPDATNFMEFWQHPYHLDCAVGFRNCWEGGSNTLGHWEPSGLAVTKARMFAVVAGNTSNFGGYCVADLRQFFAERYPPRRLKFGGANGDNPTLGYLWKPNDFFNWLAEGERR